MRAFNLLLFFCGATFYAHFANAQEILADSIKFSKPAIAVTGYFNQAIGQQSEIFNGAVYTISPPANKGTFYFLDKAEVTPGRILYNGTWYNNVPVLYDVNQDKMVSVWNDQLYVLAPQNLAEVYLSGHHFINITAGNSGKLAEGYYDELFNGSIQVLVKRTKLIEEHLIPPQTAVNYYVDKAVIYIKKGTTYYEANSKSELFKILETSKKDLKRYFDNNKIDYKADPEIATVKAAEFYDRINK